ncbi:MAG: molybdate ABC transporter substrate-binding protein [Clostridiales bacterium]|nr:molybdate ABC transporter substrate-binding protein [Clostridiales bacterium]
MVLGLAGCGGTSAEETAPKEEDKAVEAPAEAPEEPAEEALEETAEETGEEKELIVFAAASMTETLTEIGEKYMDENPNVQITFNFDSSGTLKTQIQEGAPCDLFISAGQKQMNQLDITADPEVNTEGLDFVDDSTRINILENKVTLCVSTGSENAPKTFDEMAAALKDGSILMAMGNSDVPVGQYTQKILAYYELSEEELAAAGTISYGSNVKEVTTQIQEGSVDCGVIYCTDAFSAELEIADYATAEMCGQVIYPAAVLKSAADPKTAQAFLDYMQEEDSMKIFEKVGFSPVQ